MNNISISYIGENLIEQKHAGSKARIDIEVVLNRYLSLLFSIRQAYYPRWIDKIKFMMSHESIKTIWDLCLNSTKDFVIIQYPFSYNFIFRKLVTQFIRHHKVILFVHDVDSLRYGDEKKIKAEINILNSASIVVVHNSKMEKVLRRYGLKVPAIELQLFDYLVYRGIPKQRYTLGKSIVFAGNLGKSSFLRKIPGNFLGLQFLLYGIGMPKILEKETGVQYKGSFRADDLPYNLEGSFGLVWDGSSLETCDGPLGLYTRFNNPHKLSLYIASGLPVIVWKQSAIADFVKSNRIGFTVNSLKEISSKIDSLTNAEYDEMLCNVRVLQSRVTKGFYTKNVLKEINNLIETSR